MSRSWAAVLLLGIAGLASANESRELSIGRPDAIVNLRTREGTEMVSGTWRYAPVRLVEVDFRAAGPDLRPTGAAIRTHDYTPKAGSREFDDSKWETLDPTTLERRRGTGRLSFCWYRLEVTIPKKVGKLETTGSTVYFEIVVDDYAEIWVDGKLPLTFGQSGGSVVKGFNARNRIVLTRNAKPGQKIQVAVFAINGPLGKIPDNYIWIRSATLDFYREPPRRKDWQGLGEVVRIDPALDAIIAPDAKLEKLADGFSFGEGPVWHRDGYLLFSDPNTNVIYSWHPTGNVSIYRTKSGYAGVDIGEYFQPGSNGLAFDREGRLTICEHGNRRIVRLEHKGPVTVLADRHEGKRLNSPNDLVYRSDGALFFTDPPYGLPKLFDDPRKETPHSGVYVLIDGKLKLASKELGGPNGLAFSPDEKYLYVGNWDVRDIHNTKIVKRYEVQKDGSLVNGRVFFDMNHTDNEIAIDGVKVDCKGNVYVCGPGGVWIISPDGKYLGKIKAPELPANLAWGDADRKTLYLTARTGLYRVRLKIKGAGVP